MLSLKRIPIVPLMSNAPSIGFISGLDSLELHEVVAYIRPLAKNRAHIRRIFPLSSQQTYHTREIHTPTMPISTFHIPSRQVYENTKNNLILARFQIRKQHVSTINSLNKPLASKLPTPFQKSQMKNVLTIP